jgi:hypothetical protein
MQTYLLYGKMPMTGIGLLLVVMLLLVAFLIQFSATISDSIDSFSCIKVRRSCSFLSLVMVAEVLVVAAEIYVVVLIVLYNNCNRYICLLVCPLIALCVQ